MQNKGIFKFFGILLALVCAFQLSFTFIASNIESKAKKFADNEQVQQLAAKMSKGDESLRIIIEDSITRARERYYLDSMSHEVVYNILLRKYTYKDVKERELNLGLDLKGGMNVMMEVSNVAILKALSNNNNDSTFVAALNMASAEQKNSTKDYVTLFYDAYKKLSPNGKLAAIFGTVDLKDKINIKTTNDEVIKVLREEVQSATDRTFNILRTRIDRFGVAQPNIQKLPSSGRILIELPGVKEPERVRKLLQGSAKLEFWETFKYAEDEDLKRTNSKQLYQIFSEINDKLKADINARPQVATVAMDSATMDTTAVAKVEEKIEAAVDTVAKDAEDIITDIDTTLSASADSVAMAKKQQEDFAKNNPLFSVLVPPYYQTQAGGMDIINSALVGRALVKDTITVNGILKTFASEFPKELKLMWSVKADKGTNFLELVAIKDRSMMGEAPLTGESVADARQDIDPLTGTPTVDIQMNAEGARVWKRLTGNNIGSQIAIVLDNSVYSYPNVDQEIAGGRSVISGGAMTIEEAQDLSNVLKAGKLPAPAYIVQEEVVGPSLGKEAVNAGMFSFIAAFVLVLIYMAVYYSRAGIVADIALLANMFFIFGVLASFGAVLTLPGIAGIVLTLGMAVDANVIIYERIREELRAGKALKQAIKDGYSNAYSAIIDGNVTTLLTGIVLYIFGSGPIQGFATTLIIGIISSLFTSIYISRMIFDARVEKGKNIPFSTSFTKNLFTNTKIDFIGKRKITFIISGVIIALGLVSLFTKGLSYGVDFTGGRTYIVRFDQPVNINNVRTQLEKEFGEASEVKTFGAANQIKITTKYKYNELSVSTDSLIATKMYVALKGDFAKEPTRQDFVSTADSGSTIGILNIQMVDSTVADDLKTDATLAVFFAILIIFIYIAVRFNKWQYGAATVAGLFHIVLLVIGLYSILNGIMPFSMDIDQSFIAALLTIIGYSINDNVIIFDRIREEVGLHPKQDKYTLYNQAMNSTLGRTVNTTTTTLVTLLVIFIFGGEVIRGFVFALGIGIAIGVYSTLFNATPIVYELITRSDKKKLAKLEAAKRK